MSVRPRFSFSLRVADHAMRRETRRRRINRGVPLIFDLARKAARLEFGSDLIAGFSIVTGVLLHEYLVASIVCSNALWRFCFGGIRDASRVSVAGCIGKAHS